MERMTINFYVIQKFKQIAEFVKVTLLVVLAVGLRKQQNYAIC
ncbi:hypothetical protein [Staphylococcus lutrae]|nr:hypothetical protein [Staphylococcus lutrae]